MTIGKSHKVENAGNTIVHIVFISPKHPELGEYECVGALVRDEKDMVRVCFNAKDNIVKDYLDIQRTDIVSIDIIDPAQIESLQ